MTQDQVYALLADGTTSTSPSPGQALAVVNARVKVTPYEPQDPFLRKLR